MYPYIYLGTLQISSFSLFVGIGVTILLIWFFLRSYFKYRIKFEELLLVTIFMFISLLFGFLGGMVFDALVKIPERGGFVMSGSAFYGGFICAVLVFVLLMRIFPKVHPENSTLKYLNIVTPCVIVAHVFGRIGCFMAGCCYGVPTEGILGILFPEGSPAALAYGYGVKVYPTQLFEAASLVVILLLTYFLTKKTPFYHYIVLYAIARFIIEFYRGDDRGVMNGLSPSQYVAIVMFVVGLFFLLYPYIKEFYLRHKNQEKSE